MFQFEGSGFIEFLNVPYGTLSHPTWQEDLVFLTCPYDK